MPSSRQQPDNRAKTAPRRILTILAVTAGLAMLGLWGLVASSHRAPELGIVQGRLTPCPDRPNCVSSQTPASAHKVQPLPLDGQSAAEALDQLSRTLATLPGISEVERNSTYLRFECRSPLLGFVDDLEFLVDESAGLIHVRSASRAGYSDWGVNQSRVESIRRLLNRG